MSSILVALIVTVAAIIGILSTKYLGDNNIVEELAEEIIKEETGVDIDLFPSSSANYHHSAQSETSPEESDDTTSSSKENAV